MTIHIAGHTIGADPQQALLIDLARFAHRPLAFVYWAFPWGEPDSELAGLTGPMQWQIDILRKVEMRLITPHEAIRMARTSGHGIGKSALVSWLILWSISTFPDTKGVVTANTERQLVTKTWAELAKWYRLFIARHLFHMTATAIYSVDPEHERTWRIDMIPWSEKNPAAFAGLHNKGRRIILIFDEASEIHDLIYETAEGALTDSETEILWFLFGNPTRSTGRFRECFPGGRFAHRWDTAAIDSRTVPVANQALAAEWIEDYGEDSDFVRVRVRGVFPRQGDDEFIPQADVAEARVREALSNIFDPLILGVDVARFGGDASVIYTRKGRDGRTYPPIILRGADTMAVAARVAQEYERFGADAVFVDGGGVGGGVVDRLRQLRVPCVEIQFGSKSDRPSGDAVRYANKRAEMWGMMREWLRVGAIIDDQQLAQELVGPHYGFNGQNEILLEKKEDMKRRGLSSPDIADALALTFAYPVIPTKFAGREGHKPPLVASEYDPFTPARIFGES